MMNIFKKKDKVKPPFTNLPSFLICAEILSYWDNSDEVIDLCLDLNHNARDYIRKDTHWNVLKGMLAVQPCERIVHPF